MFATFNSFASITAFANRIAEISAKLINSSNSTVIWDSCGVYYDETFKYFLNTNNTAKIIQYIGSGNTIVVPNTINYIGTSAFDNTQIRKDGFRIDHGRDDQRNAGNDGTKAVGENVLEHDSEVVCTQGAGRQNVLLVLKAVELHTGGMRHTDPSRGKEGYEQHQPLGDIGAPMILQKGDNDHGRNSTQNLCKTLHEEVDLTAVVAGDGAPDHADDKVCHGYQGSKDKGESRTVCQAGKNVLTGLSGTKPENRLFDSVL